MNPLQTLLYIYYILMISFKLGTLIFPTFAIQSKINRNSQKYESNLLHTYVVYEFLTDDRSFSTNYF